MNKNLLALIAMGLVLISSVGTGIYLNSNQAYGPSFLSPASRFSPIVNIERSGNGYIITANRDELAKFAQNFRFDAGFVYLSTVIGDALTAGLSEEWVRGSTQKMMSKMDFGLFDLSGLYKRGDSFYLPYGGKDNGFPFVLRFCSPDRSTENPVGAPSLFAGGAKIFLENPIKDADAVDESLSSLNVRTEKRQPVVKRHIFSGKRRSIAYLNEMEFRPLLTNVANLRAIRDAVSKNYERQPNIRAFYIDLPEPVTIDGRRWSRAYVKGVVFDEKKPVAPHEGLDAMGYDQNPVIVDKSGALVSPGPDPSPEGSMVYKKAKAEFRNDHLMFLNDYLRRNNVFAAAPLGYGIFPDAPLYGGDSLGYVILGVDDRMPDRTNAQPAGMAVLGRTLRILHNAGFSHPYLYFGNISIHDKSVYVHDLDAVEYLGSGKAAMRRMVMSEIRDIFYIYMKNIYYRLSSKKAEAEGRQSLREFVDAYFYDCSPRLRDYLASDGIIKPMELIADMFFVKHDREVSYNEFDNSGRSLAMLLGHNFKQRNVAVSSAAPAAQVNGGSRGYMDLDREKASATRLLDSLKVCSRSAAIDNKTIIMGLDLSWIPEEQMRAIQPALNAIKDLSRRGLFLNIIIVRGKGISLADEVLKESTRPGKEPASVIVLANGATAFGDIFTALKDTNVENKLLLIGVNPRNIKANNYVRIFEMLNMALKLALNEAGSARSPFIDVVPDPNNRRIMQFIPRSEPLSYEQLENLYLLQALAAKST